MPESILEKILHHKRMEVNHLKGKTSRKALGRQIAYAPASRSLAAALRAADVVGIIAEMKGASPSAGVIRRDFDPVKIAAAYLRAGANALSVLTDEKYFSGSISHIRRIRPETKAPILRKDFIIDEYQIIEAKAAGADAVLLIVAALSDRSLKNLLEVSKETGLEALVEVHNREELNRALHQGAEIIGINNRNLKTFAIDLAITEQLAPHIPPGITLVAESGLSTGADVRRMIDAGAHAVLIGSRFMRHPDPGQALQELRESVSTQPGIEKPKQMTRQ